MAEFKLPSLGADMDEATFVEWRIKPGDRVKRGDIVGAVETSKGIIDIEIFDAGVVESLLVEPGARVPVGTVLAQIRSDAPGTTPAVSQESVGAASAATPVSARPTVAAEAAPTRARAPAQSSTHVRASPAARKRAAELQLALETVRGTGPEGAITLQDVEHAASSARSPLTAQRERADMRATIASAMTRAKRDIPHYYLATTIDLNKTTQWLAERNRERPITERLLAGLLFVRAVARALGEFPDFNGFCVDGRFTPAAGIHVGVAVALRGGGLVAPALHDADRNDLDTLMRSFQNLVTRARSGHLRASEMSDPTITVTSLGERGVDLVFPVIYPPQVAIVGFGRVAHKPIATADGGLAVHPVVQATLAADHRVGDGHRGGLFLAAIEHWLQTPETL